VGDVIGVADSRAFASKGSLEHRRINDRLRDNGVSIHTRSSPCCFTRSEVVFEELRMHNKRIEGTDRKWRFSYLHPAPQAQRYALESHGSTVIIMHFSARFSTLILAAAIAVVGCSEPLWEPPIPGSVMAERSSPDKSLLARVIAAEAQGRYTLEVCDVRKGDVLAERTVTAPVGYHAHIVSLTWSEDSRTVTATIDHDFGDDNRVFDLSTERTDA
jgi:hypothetical protein